MWEKIKLIFQQIKPDLIRLLKALIKIGVDVLLPLAFNAVRQAEAQPNLKGMEKMDFAINLVKAQAPNATLGAIMTAVQNEWAAAEANDWK